MNDFQVSAKAIAAPLSEEPVFMPPPPSLAGSSKATCVVKAGRVTSSADAYARAAATL